MYRVTSVRENQGESGNFTVTFPNQGKSGKIDLFGENQGKIREFHYESGKKIREFLYSIYSLFFLGFPRKFRSRLRRSHSINTSLTYWLAPSALE